MYSFTCYARACVLNLIVWLTCVGGSSQKPKTVSKVQRWSPYMAATEVVKTLIGHRPGAQQYNPYYRHLP